MATRPTIQLGQEISLITRPKPQHTYAVVHLNQTSPLEGTRVRYGNRLIGHIVSYCAHGRTWALIQFAKSPAELGLC